MHPPVKYGLALGIVVAVLGFLIPIFGLHTNVLAPTLFVVLAIIVNVVFVYMALRETAATATWVRQATNGLVVGAIGGVILFASSWVMTTVVFPDYYAEYAAAMRSALETAGLPANRIDAQVAAVEASSPASSALSGAIGAVVTGGIAGAVIGLFKRRGR